MKAHGLGNRTVPGWMVAEDEKRICREFNRRATRWLRDRELDTNSFLYNQKGWGGGTLAEYKEKKRLAGWKAVQAAYEARGKAIRKVMEERAAAEQKAGESVPISVESPGGPAPGEGSPTDSRQEVPGGLLPAGEQDGV